MHIPRTTRLHPWSGIIAQLKVLHRVQTFVLALYAGCYVSFGSLLLMSCGANCPGLAESNPGLAAMVSGLFGLPTSLLLVLVAGAELFTGNVAFMTAAVAEGRAKMSHLLKSWIASYLGNFVGCVAFAFLVAQAGLYNAGGSAGQDSCVQDQLAICDSALQHAARRHPCWHERVSGGLAPRSQRRVSDTVIPLPLTCSSRQTSIGRRVASVRTHACIEQVLTMCVCRHSAEA